MKVVINGEERLFEQVLSFQELIVSLQLDPKQVAIECNGAIVPCEEHANTNVVEGDQIEIVQFIGGG